ncbi:hypothetical protein FKO01_21810 [Mesorhizobium sp. B2-3-3]|nr:hypothetical protein FKO01_21810 [Mesorhizobium sp. B2-3-3]
MDIDDAVEEKQGDSIKKFFSKDYSHQFLVISKQRALAVASDLKAVSEICGADSVKVNDVTH